MAGSAQRLQPADMGADESFRVATNAWMAARSLQMRVGSIDACLVRHVGDVEVGRPRARGHRAHLNDHAPAHVVDAGRIGELQMMNPAVHPIDDQIDLFAHLVAGQPFADDAADDRLRQLAGVEQILVYAALVGEAVAVSARCMVLMMSPRSPSSFRVASALSETTQWPGSISEARP